MQKILKHNTAIRILAGIAFLILLIWQYDYVIYFFESIDEYGFSIRRMLDLFTLFAYLLLAIGLFIKKPMVSAVGAALGIFYYVRFLIQYFVYGYGIDLDFLVLLAHTIFFIFILLACVMRCNAVLFTIIATAVYLVIFIINGWFTFINVVICLLRIIGGVLFGFAFATEKKPALAKTSNVAATADTESTIEKLTKLKSLLDSGIITQEEFDEKKKQMLGL